MQVLGKIRPKKGFSYPGTENKTLDAIRFKKINKIATNIKIGTFAFSPFRRIYVPKPGKTTKIPLGIPNFTDCIVQEAKLSE